MQKLCTIIAAALLVGCGGAVPRSQQDVEAGWGSKEQEASGYTVEWSKAYGGKSYEEARAVVELPDGGFLAAGWTASFGTDEDVFIVRVDPDGNSVWQKSFGGEGLDRAYAITVMSGGDYVFAGRTQSFAEGDEAYVARITPEGAMVWQKTFSTGLSSGARSIKQTTDGGLVLAGWAGEERHRDGDLYLLRLDPDGSLLWDGVITAACWQAAHEVAETADGGFVIAGVSQPTETGRLNGWIGKTSATGQLLWELVLGPDGRPDELYGVEVVDDGFVFCGGGARKGRMRAWLMKTDPLGNVLWSRKFHYFAYGWDLAAMRDGGFILTGHNPAVGSAEAYLLKVSAQGQLEWGFDVGGPYEDNGKHILSTSDGGILMAGYYGNEPGQRPRSGVQYEWDRDFWLLKLQPAARE